MSSIYVNVFEISLNSENSLKLSLLWVCIEQCSVRNIYLGNLPLQQVQKTDLFLGIYAIVSSQAIITVNFEFVFSYLALVRLN